MAARSKKTTYKNKGKKKQSKQNPLAKDILLLGIVVFGILCLLSVFHACGILGEYLSALLFGLFGALAYIFPVYMVVACGLYIANPKNQMLRRKIWLSLGFYWSLCGAFQWVVNYGIFTVCVQPLRAAVALWAAFCLLNWQKESDEPVQPSLFWQHFYCLPC